MFTVAAPPQTREQATPTAQAPVVPPVVQAQPPIETALDFDLTIHDLSITGCLIESYHEMPAGRRINIEIDLPNEGTVSLSAESVYSRPDYGFAVKFVDMLPDTRVQLARAVLHTLKSRRPGE